MTNKKEHLLIKYKATYGNYGTEIFRTFVLNDTHTKKFRQNLINEYNIRYATAGGYDADYALGKMYRMEKITKKEYDIIIKYDLADDPTEITDVLDGVVMEDEYTDPEFEKLKKILNKDYK